MWTLPRYVKPGESPFDYSNGQLLCNGQPKTAIFLEFIECEYIDTIGSNKNQ